MRHLRFAKPLLVFIVMSQSVYGEGQKRVDSLKRPPALIPLPTCTESREYFEVHGPSITLVDFQTINAFPVALKKKISAKLKHEQEARGDRNAFYTSFTGALKDEILKAIGFTPDKKLFVQTTIGGLKQTAVGPKEIAELIAGVNTDGEPWIDTINARVAQSAKRGTQTVGIAEIAVRSPFTKALENVLFERTSPLWSSEFVQSLVRFPLKGEIIYKKFVHGNLTFYKVEAPRDLIKGTFEGYFLRIGDVFHVLVPFQDPKNSGERGERPLEYLFVGSLESPNQALVGLGRYEEYVYAALIRVKENGELECFRQRSGYVD